MEHDGLPGGVLGADFDTGRKNCAGPIHRCGRVIPIRDAVMPVGNESAQSQRDGSPGRAGAAKSLHQPLVLLRIVKLDCQPFFQT